MRARDILCSIVGGVAIFVACGRGETPAAADVPEGFADGSRIKARWTTVVFADGAKGRTFAGWWDSERKEECTPSTMSAKLSGPGWCIPAGYTSGETPLFEDAACSKLLALDPIPGAKGAVYAGKLFAHGDTVPVPVTVWRLDDKGACAAASTTWSRAGIVRPVEVPLSQFVAVTITAP